MKTVFFDVDTQLDFLLPAGALYAPGAERVIPALRTLTQFAAKNRITIVSTADAHTENDIEFHIWRPHCVIDTAGQAKEQGTLVPGNVVIDRAAEELPEMAALQFIVEKSVLDVFESRNLVRVLDAIPADRFVLYGVVTEICVASAAIGLLRRGARVELVTDAIKSFDDSAASKFLERFAALGGTLTSVSSIVAS